MEKTSSCLKNGAGNSTLATYWVLATVFCYWQVVQRSDIPITEIITEHSLKRAAVDRLNSASGYLWLVAKREKKKLREEQLQEQGIELN